MDLTTLAAVKRYLGSTSSNTDDVINQLIVPASRTIENYTSQQFQPVVRVNKRLTGSGTSRLVLPDTPIVDLVSLSIATVDVPESTDGLASGYMVDETSIVLVGRLFPMTPLQVVCSWNAGFRETESGYIPTSNTPTLTPTTGGRAISVRSVTNVAGVPFTEVANAPSSGQFSFSADTFTFSSSDSGTLVEMDYYYVPSPVEQACIEMVALDLKQRTNVGLKSQSIGQQTLVYDQREMTPSVREMLNPFRKVAPA